MGDANPIRTLGDYSRPSHKGYRNTIELPEGNNVVPLRSDTLRPNPQPRALGTTFEARVRDYMASHTERMERFGNAIFKQREEINDRMTEMFRLFKELTTNRAPEKVLMREEDKHRITKNVNSISLIRGEEEKNEDDNIMTGNSIKDLTDQMTERGIKNDIDPIALTMTVNRLVLEWEERIKLHKEKEMEFDQWRRKTFKNKYPDLFKAENEVKDEGEVT
ncbi:hypothetical protein Tco_0910389 [Tanacetum coccineum]|uniref:Uncharacterized protein n=1 Tax=Tanacetum coccineum TaxID=301880 RepID=A0ABQ5CZW5_9ASTR